MKAKFRTAYDQREVVIDAKVMADVTVGTLVTVTYGTPNSIAVASSKDAATHVIAQSDTTMEYGHVPVENRDYRYSDAVKASNTEKKVALFPILDKNDLITY